MKTKLLAKITLIITFRDSFQEHQLDNVTNIVTEGGLVRVIRENESEMRSARYPLSNIFRIQHIFNKKPGSDE